MDSSSYGTDGGQLVLIGDDTVDGAIENCKRLEAAINVLRDSFTSEELSDNSLFNAIYGRYNEMKESVDTYNSSINNLNNNLAQQTMLTSLQGRELPKTEVEFDNFKKELIDTAIASKQFVGDEKEITNAISNYLATVPEFKEYYSEAIDSVDNAVNKNNIIKSLSAQLSKVQSLKTGFDQLKSIYDDVENAGTFDFSSIIGNTDFQTNFGKYTEEYENFIQTISNSPNDIQKCQDAFNQLATAYIYNSDALKSLDGSVASTSAAINMLSTMGVSNAQEIVNHVIAARNAYRELAVAVGETTYSTENLEEATISDMYALLNEGDMADKTKNQILAYYLQKQSAAGLQFSSEADCEQLKAIVSVLGVASSAWDTYYEHKQNIEKFTKKAENANSSKAKKSAEKMGIS